MLKVGLTGGIASGKSIIGEMFVALGAHLIQADAIAHQLMQPGETVYQEVVRHFGEGILNADGTVSEAQGYLFSRPVPAVRVRQLLNASHGRRPDEEPLASRSTA